MAKVQKLKIEDLTKRNVWAISAAELNRMLIDAKRRDVFAELERHYMNIIRPVFDLQYLNRSDEARVEQLRSERYDIFSIPAEGGHNAVAIRKRSIAKVSDLTLENISHQQASDVLRLIENNLGTGWQGLPLPLQDIIQSAFYVDCSVMPTYALHKKGGLAARRKKDGYYVLEIPRGSWTEAIFIKAKPNPVFTAVADAREDSRSEREGLSDLARILAADDEGGEELPEEQEAGDEDLQEEAELDSEEALDVEPPLTDELDDDIDDEDDNPQFVALDDIDEETYSEDR